MVDRGTVFVGDVEAAIGTDREAFAVHRKLGGTERADQGDVLIDLRIFGTTDAQGVVGGVTGTVAVAVAGEHEEGALRKSDEFGLLGGLVRHRAKPLTAGHRELDQVMLSRVGRGGVLSNIVKEEAGVGAVEVLVARVILTGCGLEHRHQELAVRGDIDCFHALVVAATTGLISRSNSGRVGGEAGETRRTEELRNQGLNRGDDTLHLTRLAHVVDRGAVFVRDVEAAIGTDRKAFAVHRELGDAPSTGGRDVGEAAEGRARRVERRGGVAVKVGNGGRALEGQRQLSLRNAGETIVWSKREIELLDAGSVVDQAADIVTTVR